MSYFSRVLEKTNRVLVPIGIAAMLIMVVNVVINVVGRALFAAPLFGSVEIVELTSVILVSFVAAYTQFRKENIIVGIVVDRFSPRLRAAFDAGTSVLGLIIIVVLAWTSIIYTRETLGYGEITHVFEISTVPFRIIWILGLIALAAVLVGQLIESLIKAVKK